MGKVKKIVVVLLVLGMMTGCVLPGCVVISKAAGVSEKAIEYCAFGEKTAYTDSAEEAFRACRFRGEIYFNKDYHLDIKEWTSDLVCMENTLVTVRPGVTLTLGKGGLKMGGQLQIYGTVDLEHSKGDLWGTDQVFERSGGKLIKRPYEIECIGDTPFITSAIYYGQPLSESEIKPEDIFWKSSVKGEWSLSSPSYVYDMVGTWSIPAIFKPERPFTYDEKSFSGRVKITVNKTYPKLSKCSVPEIHYGETLAGVKPEYSFVNPYSGEPVKGTLTFRDEREVLGRPATEQNVLTKFTPDESGSRHYTSSYQQIKIKVLPVMPEVINYPQACDSNKCGQILQNIWLLPGKCRNPYTGGEIKGSWEWKEPSQKLQPGENTCSVLFVPEEKGYKKCEGSITLKVQQEAAVPTPTAPSTMSTTSTTSPSPALSTGTPVKKGSSTPKTVTGKKKENEDKPPIIITRMVSRRSTIRFAKRKTLSAKAQIKKIKRSGNRAKVVCKKIAKMNYEVQYNVGKKWKSAKKRSFTSSVMTIRKLKSKKKYYFRVRVWKKSGKKKIYGKWSGVKRK